MSWPSFTIVTDAIKVALQNDADLKAFCLTEWQRAQKVEKAFKKREEILQTDLPVILFTVPAQKTGYAAGRLLHRKYVIRCYAGFQQHDRVKAHDEIIRFEEFIEQALLKDATLNDLGILITPGDSANDEGFYHPTYFLAKDFEVLVEREF